MAFVAAWLPGSEGLGVRAGFYTNQETRGVYREAHPHLALFVRPIPINTGTDYSDEANGSGGTPLFPYGYGLTY
jgi:hypothetical protein